MTVFEEGRHAGEFLLSEANFHRSREKVTIKSGSGVVEAGTVLGIVTADKKYAKSGSDSVTGFAGAEVAKAINIHRVDASTSDIDVSAIVRDAEVNGFCIEYDASADKVKKATELASVGIIVR